MAKNDTEIFYKQLLDQLWQRARDWPTTPKGNFLGDPPRDESSVTDPGRVVFLSYASQDA
jgi:hypothetical protein